MGVRVPRVGVGWSWAAQGGHGVVVKLFVAIGACRWVWGARGHQGPQGGHRVGVGAHWCEGWHKVALGTSGCRGWVWGARGVPLFLRSLRWP